MYKSSWVLILLLLAILIGCTDSVQEKEEIPAPTTAMLQKADSAVMVLGKSLKLALIEKMQSEGVEAALDFCSLSAMGLTFSIDEKLESFSFKRTSDRFRNQQNAPDSLEVEALNYFLSTVKNTDKIPGPFIQKFLNGDQVYYRYNKPLKIEAACLNCHGGPEQIAPSVQLLIDKYYPEDKAKGYQIGEFRGLIRAEFKK